MLLYCNPAALGAFFEVDGRTVWIGRKSYAKPNWPLATLAPGRSFLIPMQDGTDATGRTEQIIRAYITRHARESLTRFHVHRVDGGLLVIRSEKPPVYFARLR